MSSSSVCQGLQSCFEPWLTEPHVETLKSTPSKSIFSQSISPISPSQSLSQSHTRENTTTTIIKPNDDYKMKSEKTEEDKGGWSFLQCLTNTTTTITNANKEEAADGNEKVYVHPFVKRSSSMLSEKSLEMCTESLGSETGSLVSESSDDDDGIIINTISSTGGINNYYTSTQKQRESNLVNKKRTNNRGGLISFPPPLTSISCSNGVQVRPHREGGRLVLQAVTVSSSPPPYFQAERSDGRLRLCLVKDLDHDKDEDEEEEGKGEEEEEEEEEEVNDDEDEDGDEEEDCSDHVEDVEGKNEKERGEIGIENLSRPSRCNEGGGGAGNRPIWEAFCVAT